MYESGDVTCALTYVHGEKETIVAALPMTLVQALERVLQDRHPDRGIRYNAWTRLHMLFLDGVMSLVVPLVVDGQLAEYTLTRPLVVEGEDNIFTRMASLPLEPLHNVPHDNPAVLASITRARSVEVELESRAIDLADLPTTPERVWIDTANGWVGITGNMMLGVWLQRRDGRWGVVPPTATGAVIPNEDRFEVYKRGLSTII